MKSHADQQHVNIAGISINKVSFRLMEEDLGSVLPSFWFRKLE